MKIKPSEIFYVDDNTDEASCDGGDGALGHPVVWYSFAKSDIVQCHYCDRAFIKNRAKSKFE